ncbi:MAG: alpha/beta hydrolase [Halioglobus sp.]
MEINVCLVGVHSAGQRRLVLASLFLVLAACAGNPSQKIVQQQGFISQVVAGAPFLHQVYSNAMSGDTLHVYIEGDGRPWLGKQQVSPDPTPMNPLMLRLMASDSEPSIYLGRPCYFNLPDPQCAPQWWTQGRYSAEVVTSLSSALDYVSSGHKRIILIGHSGGGTLAMLLAARRSDVVGVITLAGNLDITAWANYHGYTPLALSLNPADEPPLGAAVAQRHYIGEKDSVITVEMLSRVIERQPAGTDLKVIKNADHACCWEETWVDLLEQFEHSITDEHKITGQNPPGN